MFVTVLGLIAVDCVATVQVFACGLASFKLV